MLGVGWIELVVLIYIGVALGALTDAIARPRPVWQRAGVSKVRWVLALSVFLPVPVPAAMYLATVRPRLKHGVREEPRGRRPV